MIFIVFKSFHEPLDIIYVSNNSTLDKGALMGARNSMKSLGQVIGPFIGGLFYDKYFDLPFYFAGYMLILSGIILMFLLIKTNKRC